MKDYYPFGMVMPGRNYTSASGYRYGFNGMEKDDEVKGNNNSLDFGARIYDPRVGRWLSVDPYEDNFPWQSPYVSFDNDPVNKIDPDGESGIAIRKKNKVVIKSKMYYYGDQAKPKLAKSSAMNIEGNWNAANGTVTINGIEYPVEFKVKGRAISERRAIRMADRNKNTKRNFIRVTNGKNWSPKAGTKSSNYRAGGNSGVFIEKELNNKTTDAHEYGHGLDWYEQGDRDGGRHDMLPLDKNGKNPQPGIMSPRGTPVYDEYGYPGQPSGQKTLNPDSRSVLPEDIDKIGINVSELSQKRRSNVGNTTNEIYNDDGTEKPK